MTNEQVERRWQLHVKEWSNCTKCEYSKVRKRVVLGRGHFPCDILFVGEAPGSNENMLGLPFIGKAGKLLDRIITKVFGPDDGTRKYKITLTNMLGCIPRTINEDGSVNHEKEEPDDDCVLTCRPRLEDFLEITQPKLLFATGKLASDWFDQRYKKRVVLPIYLDIPIVNIIHPSAIQRLPLPAQNLAEHKVVIEIAGAVKKHLEEGD